MKAYDWDSASDSELRKLYKISSDYLHLTPSSKMRLAAQVFLFIYFTIYFFYISKSNH